MRWKRRSIGTPTTHGSNPPATAIPAERVLFVRVPTAEFRHVGDKYADLIQEAIDNLGLEYEDVQFVTPDDDPAATPIRHDGGLSCTLLPPSSGRPSQSRFDWDGAAQLNPALHLRRLRHRQRQPVRPRRLPGRR